MYFCCKKRSLLFKCYAAVFVTLLARTTASLPFHLTAGLWAGLILTHVLFIFKVYSSTLPSFYFCLQLKSIVVLGDH